MKKPPHPFAWLVTLALPVLLGFMNIRLLISPAFLSRKTPFAYCKSRPLAANRCTVSGNWITWSM
jgi:hypothetical protein